MASAVSATVPGTPRRTYAAFAGSPRYRAERGEIADRVTGQDAGKGGHDRQRMGWLDARAPRSRAREKSQPADDDDRGKPPTEAGDALPHLTRIGAPEHHGEQRRTCDDAEQAGRVERRAARVFRHCCII